ncbi:D-2-hydroxyacid dehydrogenase [Nitrosophilus kaiyonis]|uniref:D-2-hydroxyacid dehydrogenase n=1 Tax=Nitrosophilus kaiyonis TaxID=2930200 RepID=UPI002491BB93|nr:D-2-hydroxyacid dehydrogenase [Nitrosophilus kaiyonis]
MKIVVLDAKTLGCDVNLDILKEFGELIVFDTTKYEETIDRIKDADIVVTNKVILDKQILESAKNLKLICIAATGMNNVDLNYAKTKNIEVKNVVGYSTESVVQHTFALAFYLIEHLKKYDEFVKSKSWSSSDIFTCLNWPFFEIHNKRWGIIGLGTIGKRVAQVAKSFGCEVVYYSTSGKNLDNEFKHIPLDTLLCTSDIISIHAPLNEKTQNLLNKTNIIKLKNRAVLLNLGRGGIINEEDLAKIVDEKEIYVGLDVTQKEPIDKNSPLLNLKNQDRVFITPHIAWTSIEARERLLMGIVKNIEEFLEGKEQ